MSKVWRRLISVLEIVGGVFGIIILAWELVASPADGYTLLLAPVSYGIFILSLVAGVLLWREHRAGRMTSVVVQAIQLPKIVSPVLIFTFSFGFDFYPYVLSDAGFSKVGVDLRLLAFHQLYLNIEEAPFAAGVSVPAVMFLIMLLRYKPATRGEMVPPPPPTGSEWSDPTNLATEQRPAGDRDGEKISRVDSESRSSEPASKTVALQITDDENRDRPTN
jgi:hypothetical protein